MNIKIDELASKCWSNPIHKIGEFDQTKFANLIIDECISIFYAEMIRCEVIPKGELSAQYMENAQMMINSYWMRFEIK
jgi:hypothetical protein